MKNKLIFLLLFFIFSKVSAENILIQSKNIKLNKQTEISIFENDVLVKTEENSTIKSDYAEYDKKKGFLKLKNNIIAEDDKNNLVRTNNAEYFENSKTFKSYGLTKITTSEQYTIETEDVILDKKNNLISSNKKTIIEDLDKNKIILDNFEYNISNNIFKSIGYIKITDRMGNSTEFSQVYIDTNKKEILGTDIKAFVNQNSFKYNEKNKPRIFSNSVKINENFKSFNKSRFTLCDYREGDKCPPWTIQASEMLHDKKKKTIYYDNAIIKVYDIPIFYFPKLSHPDPTVPRRSGFLPPQLINTKNLGSSVSVPYYWAIGSDKDLTFTNRMFASENPLFLGEYRQAFKNSNLVSDFGYTEGYKRTSVTKKSGDKSHFFLEFVKNFTSDKNTENNLKLKVQSTSDKKYLKLYKIESSLADYNEDNLENSLSFLHENNDFFLGLNASIFETLKDSTDDEHEYILPEITIAKNLFSNNLLGNLDLQSNLKVHNYETNKTTKFLTNDFNWDIKDFNFKSGLNSKLFGKIRNVNYETKNVENFKESSSNELFGAIGLLSELNLYKQISDGAKHLLTPKVLLKYSPDHMRPEIAGNRLRTNNIFTLDRLDSPNNLESGINATVGLDYEINTKSNEFNFSAGQIYSKKYNKDMPDITSLDKKTSDFVASSSLKIKDKYEFNYNFNVDESFDDLTYNEFGAKFNFNPVNFDFRYLEERKHVGDKKYFSTNLNFENDNRKISFGTKRNLVTDSAEFYNLSYEYLNDCLRAGLVYRREFYNDSELEPENTLMFKITLVPFGDIDTPNLSQ